MTLRSLQLTVSYVSDLWQLFALPPPVYISSNHKFEITIQKLNGEKNHRLHGMTQDNSNLRLGVTILFAWKKRETKNYQPFAWFRLILRSRATSSYTNFVLAQIICENNRQINFQVYTFKMDVNARMRTHKNRWMKHECRRINLQQTPESQRKL